MSNVGGVPPSGTGALTGTPVDAGATAIQQGTLQGTSVPGTPGGIADLDGDFGATVWGQLAANNAGLTTDGTGPTVNLSSQQHGQLRSLASGLTNMPSSELQSRWSHFVSDVAANGGMVDPNALVQAVLREAYLQQTEDLRFYAEKVKYFNECKKVVREYVTGLRDAQVALKKHLKDNGLPVERPKTDDPPGSQAAWDAAVTQFMMEYAANHPTAGRTGSVPSIWNMAEVDSTNEVLQRSKDLIREKFGVELPPEIETMLREGLGPPRNEAKLRAALTEFAAYMAYLGDCGVKDGQFGKAGYDDMRHYVAHVTPEPSYRDFKEAYLSSANAGARDDLASGDVRLIEQAFGWPEGTISSRGLYKQEDIVAFAMSALGDGWKNEILYNTTATSAEVADLMANGQYDHPAVIEMFGSASAAQAWAEGNLSSLPPEKQQIFRDFGIPSTCPPLNCTDPDSLEAEIKKWEERLNSIGDDAQLANVDLQNNLQKQQQTLQMMSNISKMLHDTAMAVIRKIGG